MRIGDITSAVGEYHKTQTESLKALWSEVKCLAPKHKFMTRVSIVIVALGTFKLIELLYMAAIALGITGLWEWFLKVMLL